MDNSETLEGEETQEASEEEQIEQAINEDEDNQDIISEDKIVERKIVNPEISAVFAYNGKQFPVKVGERCNILDLEIPEIGKELTIDTVMMGNGSEAIIGNPYIEDAKIVLEARHLKTKKLISFKKRRRKNSSKTTRGYRQKSTVFVATRIEIPGLPNSYIEN